MNDLILNESESLVLAAGAMLAGIALLVRGGNWTVDSAVFIARKHGISPLMIGFTIIAFGTSLPELIVSVLANLEGSPGIAMGNVIGSNIANVLLVIGATAFVATLTARVTRPIVRDAVFMLLVSALLAGLMIYGGINRIAGSGMVLLLGLYVLLQYRMALRGGQPVPEPEEQTEYERAGQAWLCLGLGLACVALGAEFLVSGARASAAVIGVPEAVIGLSVIALGTSLPELSTCIIAARRGLSDIVFGNIIGSNVFNILMIIGAAALVKPIAAAALAPQLLNFDIWVMLAISLVFSLIVVFYGKIARPAGIVFMTAYILYNIYIYSIYIGQQAAGPL